MQCLKDEIAKSPALRFILLQLGEDGKCYPNQFGSITLNKVESRYSQARLELHMACFMPCAQSMSIPSELLILQWNLMLNMSRV
ncbi:hypothetical protein PAXRUDRAFT_162210 [Paxillus rubicundulus Ve08.2h10]|uniref:Unplaced genomic scaffold scaffold_1558, whole genome shotgun sequence n=1 Tax=Paxillus rubicundulus Ve08.2h10 TaxID=930991 RepID=A0A0D0DLA2_9AGAM|nr:hypothetical protein PAXRUDRAFT_162210 [Paxillus rubicundulus Ve08.2h10]